MSRADWVCFTSSAGGEMAGRVSVQVCHVGMNWAGPLSSPCGDGAVDQCKATRQVRIVRAASQ